MVEPIPQTQVVLDELARLYGDDLAETLARMGHLACKIAPHCVGLSLGLLEDGLTFTLVASRAEIAGIDAVQYFDDGPCLAAQRNETFVDTAIAHLLDEGQWAAFARASAAVGVASTLSLPIEDEGRVIGSVNLYGSTPAAFDGRHQRLADALGASAHGAVTNADLAFHTRLAATRAPEELGNARDINIAVGIVAELREVGS